MSAGHDGWTGFYVADWLLAQGHAEQAVEEALALLVEHAPEKPAWACVGISFLSRLWCIAPLRLRSSIRAAIRKHLAEPRRDHRSALREIQAWVNAASDR